MIVTLWRRGMQGHIDWRLGALIAIGAVGIANLDNLLSREKLVAPGGSRRRYGNHAQCQGDACR